MAWEGHETHILTAIEVRYAHARATFGELYPPTPGLSFKRTPSTYKRDSLPPPSNKTFTSHPHTLCTYHPRPPSPPNSQFHTAYGSPARPSTPHWRTTTSGSNASFTRSMFCHTRRKLALDAPRARGSESVNGSKLSASGSASERVDEGNGDDREPRGEEGKNPGALW